MTLINLDARRKRKDFSRNRRPLDVAESYADRLTRIHTALLKINELLKDTRHNIVESPKVFPKSTEE